MTKTDLTVATEIQKQLGGALAMLGAKNLTASDNSLSFQIRGSKKASGIHIEYDSARDLYNLKFLKSKKYNPWIVVAEHQSIFVDQLKPIIEKETGLYTRLF